MLVTVPGGGAGGSVDVELSDGLGLGVEDASSLELVVVLNSSLDEVVESKVEELLDSDIVDVDDAREVELSEDTVLSDEVTSSVDEKLDEDGAVEEAGVGLGAVVVVKT